MSGVLWAYGGVVNSQPDNNQEKLIQAESLFPTQRLFWELAVTCLVLGLEWDASLFPQDTRCWEKGGSSSRIAAVGRVRHRPHPSLAGGWRSRHGTEPREIKQPRVSKALSPPKPPAPAVPITLPKPISWDEEGRSGMHPHQCFPARSLCTFICPSINFHLALNHSCS